MLATMRAQTGEGVSLTVATEHLGGFTRYRDPDDAGVAVTSGS
jgi:hypothetical protein